MNWEIFNKEKSKLEHLQMNIPYSNICKTEEELFSFQEFQKRKYCL